MFRKLVSNLPYSPSLITQVSFYGRRLRQEEFTRRLGLIFTLLALVVQTISIFAPPEPSVASSGNDIIYGAGSKEGIIQAYQSGHDALGRGDIQQIFAYYGIDLGALQNASVVTIQSRAENNFWSIGRERKGFEGETELSANGTTIYMRPLHAFDSGAFSSYPALYGRNSQGHEFWVLLGCGNIVIKPPSSSVNLQIIKSVFNEAGQNISGQSVDPGQTIKYVLWYTNFGPTYAVYSVIDGAPDGTTLIGNPVFENYSHGIVKANDGRNFTLTSSPFGALPANSPTQQGSVLASFKVKVDENARAGQRICNSAAIMRLNPNENPVNSNEVCVTVSTPPTTPPQTIDAPMIVIDKHVSNLTQDIDDAHNTMAQAGDELRYELRVNNPSNVAFNDYKFAPEDINDILEYADLTDRGDAEFDTERGLLTWQNANIGAGQTVTKTFTVKVKDPIPSTPVSTTDPFSYDLIMSNAYGQDTVEVKLPPSTTKTVEQAVSSLPRTGNGSNVFMSIVLLVLVTYFYMRTRQLTKEIQIIKTDYNAGAHHV